MSWDYGWQPYVSVATRRRKAAAKIAKLRKRGMDIQPITIEGRKIARTFWGEAWCEHLENFSDFSNRLPRGRTYVRNGSVCHLEIKKGRIKAMVSGSSLYEVNITVKALPAKKWEAVKKRCSGKIGSLIELLQGRLSDHVMAVVTDSSKGLFPLPEEIHLNCNCPDWAVMCKHVAAVLYGIGARLDEKPELLFLLRGVNHEELISEGADITSATTGTGSGSKRIAEDEISGLFGIEMKDTENKKTAKKKAKKAGLKKKKKAKTKKVKVKKKTIKKSEAKKVKRKTIKVKVKTAKSKKKAKAKKTKKAKKKKTKAKSIKSLKKSRSKKNPVPPASSSRT